MRTLSLRTHHKDRYRSVLPRLRQHIYYATVQIPKRILGQKRKIAKATLMWGQGRSLSSLREQRINPGCIILHFAIIRALRTLRRARTMRPPLARGEKDV
jgi:hypothetical protein